MVHMPRESQLFTCMTLVSGVEKEKRCGQPTAVKECGHGCGSNSNNNGK